MLQAARSLFLLTAATLSASAASTSLYFSTGLDLPADQGWLAYASNGFLTGGVATQEAAAPGVTLTTDNAVSAGYSSHTPFGTLVNPLFPVLDPTSGFQLNFLLELHSETHLVGNRAGFSVLLIGSDLFGIELGFWEDQIWAQSGPDFNKAESVFFDTTGLVNEFSLQISGNSYSLRVSNTEILSGTTRNYSSAGIPYSIANFLFLGDNTSSAGASVSLGDIEISLIPEPAHGAALAAVLALAIVTLRRRR